MGILPMQSLMQEHRIKGRGWDLVFQIFFQSSQSFSHEKNLLKYNWSQKLSIYTVTESADFGFIPLLWLPQSPQGCREANLSTKFKSGVKSL